MNTDVSRARRAVHDQLEAQIKITETAPDTAKAHVQIKAITEMLAVLLLFEARARCGSSPGLVALAPELHKMCEGK